MKHRLMNLISSIIYFLTLSGIAYVTDTNIYALLIASAGLVLTEVVRLLMIYNKDKEKF